MSGVKASQGAAFSKIMGIGGYRPRRVVDNAEIVTYIDSSDEWIRTRSGITERRWASPDETVQMMSVAAARKAIERAGLEPGQVDTVIVATVTHLLQTPAVATTIASELGAKNAAAFDINAACAGFCYMVAMADALIRSGASKYVAIIGVERLTDLTDIHDRSTAFIFADGAGAAVIGPSDVPSIGPVVWGSDGEQADLITQDRPWDVAIPRQDRARPEDVETTRAAESDGSAPVADQVAGLESDDVLWRHVAELPERCRALLRVVAFAAKPDYAQIARALGMPVGSIGPTRGRCLAKLRLALAADPRWGSA